MSVGRAARGQRAGHLDAALATPSATNTQLASIPLARWAPIAPAQAAAAWIGASLAARTSRRALSRIFSIMLALTGAGMLRTIVVA
jgi:uncharacterized membrane protein YfcA